MKAKNIAILLFSTVIGCAVAKTYTDLQEGKEKTSDVKKERKANVKNNVKCEKESTVEHETESVQTEVVKPSYGEYASLQKSGVVGLYGGNSIDNPEDNIFEVVIPSSFSSSDKAVLSYDVEGVAGSTGVALSINDRTAMGGMVAYSSDKRSSVSEEIDAAWLVKGKNRIMFTLPDSANYGYRVSNLKIAISANTASGNIVATASKLDGEVYVRGFVKNAKAKSVNIAGKEYELTHGSFEALIYGDDEDVRITCGDASKTFHATTVSGCIASTRLICVNKSEKQTQKEFSLAKKENNKVQDVAATLNVDSGVVKKDMKITMTNLRHKDLPALDLGMTNVTDGVEGYRFLPHGAHFDGEGAVVSLKYDRTKIPSGYTENDIRTYYFDLDTKHWVALKRDSIDKENNLIVSRTNHFTDMINGVIQAPESPETQGFTPTMMSDLKLADPTAKIQSIAPPTANNRGSANLSYSFEMPPARHGMQPSLGIQYNSDGGTGLLGEGWDLSVPTISVETRWGVPRYDDILETETYLMDGSMLVLDNGGVNYLAHRATEQIKRASVKRTNGAVIFHPRKEGSFSKIERFGNSPAEYTWVVTDKSGTKYYYGKKNADGSMKGVLMGKNYEGNDVIAEWKLVRVQEFHGDWIEYEYETIQEDVLGGTTNALYLKEVRAGNSNSKAHTRVEFLNNEVKKIKRGNARYGFLTSNIHMLKDVTVYYEDAMLRKYSFGYKKDTPFSADLLETVSHYDASGKLVASNTMTYHEMEGTSLYNVDVDDKFSSKETIKGVFPKILKDGFDDHLTMINGGQSKDGFSVGGGCNVGVLTVFGGLSYSYGNNDSEGKISLTDINGDGIPDKVFANEGIFYEEGVYVKKEDKSGEVHEFKPAQPCGGTLKLFSKSSSSSHTLGEDVGVGIGPASISATFSQTWETSKVPVYFNDFNSDGLIDIAYNGRVYFNHLDSEGIPTFSEYSSETENPLSNMKKEMIPDFDGFSTNVDRAAVEKSLKEKFPLHDVVRVWKAPFDGQIEITGDITVSSSSDKNADGIEYAIQIENVADEMKHLANGESAQIYKTGTVQKGDRVFFRVGSKEQGVNDEVTWSPVIRYINNPVALDVDENGLSLTEYSAKNDFLDGFVSTATVEGPATVTIKGDYDFQGALVPVNLVYEAKTKSKEDVKNSEIGAADGWTSIDTDVITLDNNSASSGSKEYREINVSENDVLVLSFDIKSDAQIDPHKIVWSPLVTVNKEGAKEEKVEIYPKRQMYNNVVSVYGPTVINAKTLESEQSSSESIEYADDNVYLECETAESFEDKDLSIFIMDSEGVMEKLEAGASKVYKVDEIHNKAVRIIVYSDSPENASAQYKVVVKRVVIETYEDEEGVTQTKNYFINENDAIPATIYCQSDAESQRLGSLYRGWGAFAYMGTVGDNGKKTAINPSDLLLDTKRYEGYDEETMKDWDENDDNLNEKIKGLVGNESANETKFFSMCYSVADKRYVGATILAYLDGERQCPSRMGNPVIDVKSEIPSYDFSIDPSSEKTGVAASPTLLSTSFTHSATLGGGVKAGKFGVGASGSHSETSTKTETSIMDLNGDGYPDWLSGDDENINIKYTIHDGTLNGYSLSSSKWGLPVQEAEAKAMGLNASFTPIKKEGGDGDGEANTNIFSKAAWSVDNLKKIASQKKTTECSVSASGNMSDGESHSINEWYDINGDGLPDMVYDNGKVRVNLGYSFSEAVKMDGLDNICKGESSTWGAGLGVAVTLQGKANISVGTNATFTETYGTHQYMDVNGDGLPDKVFYDDPKTPGVTGIYYANINTGTGFDSNKWYLSGSPINKSKSTAASVYANGGATIPAGWIVTVTPFVSGATTDAVSKTQKAMSDFDGDGFPDLLESDSETSLSVHYSKVGATNKLKTVTTPFGGSYELEYIHSTPTQEHPGGKWVMSKLTVTDTQRDINDCPPVVSVFDYAGGKRDRRERDFYGFAEVRTKRMNVNEEGNSVVESQIVQNYDVTNYYSAGTAIGSYVCDADQQQFFSKETSKLNMYDVSDKGSLSNERAVSATASFDENGRYFVAPVKSTTMRFEPKNENGESGENGENENKDDNVTTNIVENKYGNFGNLTEYKYTDGITDASYTTTIQYKDYDEETGVFGLPIDVVVKSGDQTMRHVSAEYDMLDNNKESGYNPTSMTKMTQYLGRETAEVEFKYDTLGNIIEKIMPQATGGNLMNKRMTYTYEYDKKHRMYPIRVTDGFGYRSDMFNYDYRYGIPLSVKDMNGFITEYEIDDLGRVTKVIAPNEMSAAKNDEAYTIKYEYFSGDKIRMAKTYHYDPQHEDQAMITVNIVDGFGRELQARKSAEIDGDDKFMIVSGKTTFDALGRELSHYAPTTCLKSEMENLTCNFSDLKLDLTTYDAFDRPNEKTVYDEKGTHYVTKMEYSIEDDKLKTTVTDAEGMVADAYTDGTEHTLKTVKKHENGEDPATTKFDFDGIGQLLKVTDPAGKFTEYTYDMAGRKLSVANPSAGTTTFTYDNLGNVLTKTTGKGDVVTYKYEYNRLVEQIYGNDKWKNNVKYTYGGVDAKHNRVGRLALVEDGSGAQEYFYGKMGEVEKIRRTIIIPGVDVATYTTEWKYDSWNRIQEMIYPDGEKIKYYYNLGGQLKKILGQKNYICTYIDEIKYDEYEQRSFIRYGNGTETTYKYEDGLRRLKNMTVANKEEKVFLNNTYTYDKVNNILSVVNAIDKEKALNAEIGGTTSHTYTYDDWHRLKTATGVFNSFDGNKSADYQLVMGYDNLYNITSKKLTMSQTNLQFAGTLSAGHEFSYNYSTDNPMQLASVETKQYNVDGTIADVDEALAKNIHTQDYEFDKNGNMISVSVAKKEEPKPEVENPESETPGDEENPEDQNPGDDQQASEGAEEKDVLKSFLWDEENRLLAVNNNGSVSCYFYDAAGERTVKLTSESEMVHVNGKKVGGNANICKFTAYVSPYFVVSNGGAYTKHIYAASQRIASKLGNEDGFGADPRRVEMAGGKKISDIQKDNIGARFSELGFTYTAPEKEKVEKDSTMDSEAEEKLIFFYHPDHLGSTSYVTDADGNIAQHIEYIPYGEVFVEERNSQFSTNYLFNAKELDNETGLYYYGARYLDPTGAMWLSVDPMWEKYMGISPYAYCLGNPVRLKDPDGNDLVDFVPVVGSGRDVYQGFSEGNGLLVASGIVFLGVDIFTMGSGSLVKGAIKNGFKYIFKSSAKNATKSAVETTVKSAAETTVKESSESALKQTTKGTTKAAKKQEVDFIVDTDGKIIDPKATPKGSYRQPNGDRTDVLQTKPHRVKTGGGNTKDVGTTHTHPHETNTDPSGIVHEGWSENAHAPTFEEVQNIMNGKAIKMK